MVTVKSVHFFRLSYRIFFFKLFFETFFFEKKKSKNQKKHGDDSVGDLEDALLRTADTLCCASTF